MYRRYRGGGRINNKKYFWSLTMTPQVISYIFRTIKFNAKPFDRLLDKVIFQILLLESFLVALLSVEINAQLQTPKFYKCYYGEVALETFEI